MEKMRERREIKLTRSPAEEGTEDSVKSLFGNVDKFFNLAIDPFFFVDENITEDVETEDTPITRTETGEVSTQKDPAVALKETIVTLKETSIYSGTETLEIESPPLETASLIPLSDSSKLTLIKDYFLERGESLPILPESAIIENQDGIFQIAHNIDTSGVKINKDLLQLIDQVIKK